MEYNAPATLTTPWGALSFNAATKPTYYADASKCAGLDMAPVRATVEDKPTSDGGIVHNAYLGARHITLGGALVCDTLTDRQTLEDNLNAALTSILRADGSLVWHPADGSTRTITTVRCEIPASFDGYLQKNYLFGLVAADPTITIT